LHIKTFLHIKIIVDIWSFPVSQKCSPSSTYEIPTGS